MCRKQQTKIQISQKMTMLNSGLLPKIGKKYAADEVFMMIPIDFYPRRNEQKTFQCQKLTRSNAHRFSNVRLNPILMNNIQHQEKMEKLLEFKTVALCEKDIGQRLSFWKSFKPLHDADTSAESQQVKRVHAEERKQVEGCESVNQNKFNSCRIINSKKLPFKIHSNQTERTSKGISISLWNLSRIQESGNSSLSDSFAKQIGDLLSKF